MEEFQKKTLKTQVIYVGGGEVDKIAKGNNYERGERGRSIFVSEFVNNKLLNFLFFVNGRP